MPLRPANNTLLFAQLRQYTAGWKHFWLLFKVCHQIQQKYSSWSKLSKWPLATWIKNLYSATQQFCVYRDLKNRDLQANN
jgi:hypothetical protein